MRLSIATAAEIAVEVQRRVQCHEPDSDKKEGTLLLKLFWQLF